MTSGATQHKGAALRGQMASGSRPEDSPPGRPEAPRRRTPSAAGGVGRDGFWKPGARGGERGGAERSQRPHLSRGQKPPPAAKRSCLWVGCMYLSYQTLQLRSEIFNSFKSNKLITYYVSGIMKKVTVFQNKSNLGTRVALF